MSAAGVEAVGNAAEDTERKARASGSSSSSSVSGRSGSTSNSGTSPGARASVPNNATQPVSSAKPGDTVYLTQEPMPEAKDGKESKRTAPASVAVVSGVSI